MANDVEIKLKGVRLSFFHGFVPQERKNQEGKITGMNYSAALLIPKDDEATVKVIKDAMAAAKKNQWGDNAPRFKADTLCLRDGEPLDENEVRAPLYDGYKGMFYVSANRPVKLEDYEHIKAGRKPRPLKIIGPRKGEDGKFVQLAESDPFAPYSGCYVNVVLRIYGYVGKDNEPSRINASLEAVQFSRHGERFGTKPVDVDSAFDEEDVGEDDIGGAAPATTPAPADDNGFDIG